MADYTTVMLLLATILVNYLVIFKNNRFFGDIIFMAIGASSYFILNTEIQVWGLMIMFIALADIVYGFFDTK